MASSSYSKALRVQGNLTLIKRWFLSGERCLIVWLKLWVILRACLGVYTASLLQCVARRHSQRLAVVQYCWDQPHLWMKEDCVNVGKKGSVVGILRQTVTLEDVLTKHRVWIESRVDLPMKTKSWGNFCSCRLLHRDSCLLSLSRRNRKVPYNELIQSCSWERKWSVKNPWRKWLSWWWCLLASLRVDSAGGSSSLRSMTGPGVWVSQRKVYLI